MRYTVRLLLASVVAIAVVLGTAAIAFAGEIHASATHTLSGRVFNDEDAGVDSVQVGLYQWNGSGGGWNRINYVVPLNGNFSFGSIPDGTYRLGVEPLDSPPSPKWEYQLPIYVNGSTTVTGSVDVVVNADTVLDWKLERNPVITGNVTSAIGGAALSGAFVDLYWWDEGAAEFLTDGTVTNPTGDYHLYVPNRGTMMLRFTKSDYATEYMSGITSYSWNQAFGNPRTAGGMIGMDASLDPGVELDIERAYSPFGTRLPSSWTSFATGLPYDVEVLWRSTPLGVEPAQWETIFYLPAGTGMPRPDYFPPGGYKVRFIPRPGTYLPLWHAGVADEASAQIIEAAPSTPGQVLNVWARFGGYVKASTTVRASSTSVRRGKTAKITASVRDASTTGRPSIAQPGAQVRIQRSYNNRTWSTLATKTTGTAGTATLTVKITKTAYFRAVPVTSATLQGSASRSVKVRAR
jgi:hypothetical protein